ncbi:DUF3841 domain-containing protein [Lactobacillus corticis]|uniref:DUF3841 domain-containing protein n=1 Tax=Lactobacillus corticis TaxID=2201249 RepID=A0A916QK58_9LACO|nr:DUF3841 domain-containing protein [Lactobacillus corticis]GFZ27372.1 hypothetical protein LCB40_12520 [Lactobacillus corticis]
MIIWTIQPYEVYQEILDQGIFYCNPELSTNLKYDGFSKAYNWMIQQMINKIGPSKRPNAYPIWAWYRSHDYKHQRPDFRWALDYPDEVCIELEIPENQVLLSDFESWHFVLNNWFYSDATSEKEWNHQDKWFESLPKDQQRQVKENSWQRIFDITPRYGEWDKNGDSVQACFWSLRKEQIRRVWRLRKKKKVCEIYSI